MLPKGLAVLTIIALITAVFKLGRKKVLVQEIYSVETMAHVDTLCLDKTGTLTEGKMKVKRFSMLSDMYDEKEAAEIIGCYLGRSVDSNSTSDALRDYFDENEKFEAKKRVDFSSDRKWGAIYLEGVGMVVIGAPERIFEEVPEEALKRQEKGFRVLGVGLSKKKDITSKQDLKGVEPLAMVELEDSIRKDAEKTLRYFREQGVETKIISGDNPLTVSKIAERAGFEDFEKFLDVTEMSNEDLAEAVKTTAIFGRVNPRQKKFIVQELKKAGKTVAMTGDGVNDILALREADLSIVMAEGDSATKQISNVVLLESSFSELPDVLFEGRRVVNNMFRVASLFFIKTIYSFFLSVLCALSIVTGSVIVFPFISLQITVIDQVLEGFPTLFMSFEADKTKIQKNFLKTSLLKALPQSIMVTVSVVFIYFFATAQGWSQIEMTTLMYYMLGTITLIGLFKSCSPFSKLRAFLFTASTVGFYASAYILGRWFSDLVKLEVLSGRAVVVFLILTACAIATRIAIDWVKRRPRGEVATAEV
jgi:cation-transporting ATPase E